MKSHVSQLTRKSLLLLFAYAPAGLGHLRVTDALYDGLSSDVYPYLLGSQDKRITAIHRIMSIHAVTRALFEWLARGVAEDITTRLYRTFLRTNTDLLHQQLTTILDQRLHTPDTLLLVATHFGLAHQAAALKDRLQEERKIKMIIAVQVTDDSPHHIWYVPGADIIFVPSDRTKAKLEAYGREEGLPAVHLEVNPYPISPTLKKRLTADQQLNRLTQLRRDSKSGIHMAIPISGAAVGMAFFTRLIDELYEKSRRFTFHVVTKNAPFTQQFIYEMNNRTYVHVYTSAHDKDIINAYEDLYKRQIIALEVTKPSEQAFKALIDCDKRGASILLFSRPVGQQEYDNLDFLRRHKLIPQVSVQQKIWQMARQDRILENTAKKEIIRQAYHWRGMYLPDNPIESAQLVWWCMREGIFTAMASCRVQQHNHYELQSNGVEEFWKKVAALVM